MSCTLLAKGRPANNWTGSNVPDQTFAATGGEGAGRLRDYCTCQSHRVPPVTVVIGKPGTVAPWFTQSNDGAVSNAYQELTNSTAIFDAQPTSGVQKGARGMQNSAPPQGPGAEGEAQGKKREAGVRGLVGGVAPAILSVAYLAGMLILPVLALLSRAVVIPPGDFWRIATQPVALSAYTVTLSMAVCATLFNGFFGFLLAWVLSRYEFPGRKALDAAVDLPFALPTAVAGLALATVYSSQGWLGRWFVKAGINLIFTRAAVFLAMVFVSFPFVVRSLQPVMADQRWEGDGEVVRPQDIVYEEVSYSLGATPTQTFFRVVLPPLMPALLTGMTLSFSRALGEYGSIVIVASNIPLKDLVAPVLIFQNLEQYDYQAATVIGAVALATSLVLLYAINLLQAWSKRSNIS